tara:strand:- start:201 stop:419 length:219 start_codon:yes stop_codon:yes gene_type:complete
MKSRILDMMEEIKGLIKDKLSDRWLNIREVASYASVSETTIRRAVKRGSLNASKVTGKLLFKVSCVDRWLNG